MWGRLSWLWGAAFAPWGDLRRKGSRWSPSGWAANLHGGFRSPSSGAAARAPPDNHKQCVEEKDEQTTSEEQTHRNSRVEKKNGKVINSWTALWPRLYPSTNRYVSTAGSHNVTQQKRRTTGGALEPPLTRRVQLSTSSLCTRRWRWRVLLTWGSFLSSSERQSTALLNTSSTRRFSSSATDIEKLETVKS